MSERQSENEKRELMRTRSKDWPRFAEAMGWTPEGEAPSWMTPEQRSRFWKEVAEADREAVLAREVAKLQAELAAAFSPPLLFLGRILGRLHALIPHRRDSR